MSSFTTVKEAYEHHEKGKRRTMEDNFAMKDSLFDGQEKEGEPHLGYFAIFDGHGGKSASEWASKNLHAVIADAVRASQTHEVDGALMEQCFTAADQKMIASGVEYPGCTATVCLIDKARSAVHVANVGDSHAYLITRDAAPERLTTEHRCANPDEKARIEGLGGFVNGGKVNGLLEVTRSLGDGAMKAFLTAAPAYRRAAFDPAVDTFVIIACDGLWDGITPEDVKKTIFENVDALAGVPKMLITAAIKAGSRDNISAMVIRL